MYGDLGSAVKAAQPGDVIHLQPGPHALLKLWEEDGEEEEEEEEENDGMVLDKSIQIVGLGEDVVQVMFDDTENDEFMLSIKAGASVHVKNLLLCRTKTRRKDFKMQPILEVVEGHLWMTSCQVRGAGIKVCSRASATFHACLLVGCEGSRVCVNPQAQAVVLTKCRVSECGRGGRSCDYFAGECGAIEVRACGPFGGRGSVCGQELHRPHYNTLVRLTVRDCNVRANDGYGISFRRRTHFQTWAGGEPGKNFTYPEEIWVLVDNEVLENRLAFDDPAVEPDSRLYFSEKQPDTGESTSSVVLNSREQAQCAL